MLRQARNNHKETQAEKWKPMEMQHTLIEGILVQMDYIFFLIYSKFKNTCKIGRVLQSNYSLTKLTCTNFCVVFTC